MNRCKVLNWCETRDYRNEMGPKVLVLPVSGGPGPQEVETWREAGVVALAGGSLDETLSACAERSGVMVLQAGVGAVPSEGMWVEVDVAARSWRPTAAPAPLDWSEDWSQGIPTFRGQEGWATWVGDLAAFPLDPGVNRW